MNELPAPHKRPSTKSLLSLSLVVALGSSCTAAPTCFDKIDINPALDGSLTVDKSQPDAMATFTGSALIVFPCDAPEEQISLRDGALYEVDETTLIQKMDVQFKGGSVITAPGTCSGLGTYNVKVDLQSTGVPNSAVSAHCGPDTHLWLTAKIERTNCASGTQFPVAISVPLSCP